MFYSSLAIIKRRGKEDVVLISATELEGLFETAHLLRASKNEERLLKALNRALLGSGSTMKVKEFRKELGIGRK